jgi:hypothetical protein
MKSTKKKSAASTVAAASSAPSSLSPVGGADALPPAGAPTPPVDDNPVAMDPRKGTRVLQAEVDLAENAASELRASTVFPQILSAHFGSAEEIANAIEFAVQWYAQAKAGANWGSYTQTQSNLAWAYTLALIERLRGSFLAVAATDLSIEKELPNFTQLLGARQVVAAKAVATKRKIKSGELVVNKAAKPPRKSTKASTKATSPAQALAPAPAEATPAPAAPVTPEATPVVSSANGAAAAH